ncbi:hypothetical protein [Xenophilus sp.]|uniref:hypothetical protein n=1 Tax=Xenophilus sp. TaxID=1873499 RepID=UPI0037DC7CA0
MTPQQPPSITDVVGLGIFLASLFYSPEVAAIVGPYLVIILASVVGASFALKRRSKTTRLSALWYLLRVAGLAVIGTVSLAAIFSSYYDGLTERILIAPVALAIGAIGDDFPSVARWFLAKFLAGVDLFRSKGGTP